MKFFRTRVEAASDPKRDLRIDYLRGFALLAMTVNHLAVSQSWFYAFSGRMQFYTSAAEIFYFLSGLVFGMISARDEFGFAIKRIFKRTLVLYAAAVGMGLGFLLLGVFTDLVLWNDLQTQIPNSSPRLQAYLVGMLTLHNAFHGSQILVQYVLYMLFVPLAVWALKEKKGWWVAGVSFGVYLISQLFPGRVYLPFDVYFNLAAWNIIFFSGLVIGYHRRELANWTARLPAWIRGAALGLLGLTFVFFTVVHFSGYPIVPGLPELLGPRELMRPWRLFLAGLSIAGIWLFLSIFWKPLRKGFGWLLLPFGQNSLWVFITQMVVIVLFLNLPFYRFETTPVQGTLIHTAATLLILGSIHLRNRVVRAWPAPQLQIE